MWSGMWSLVHILYHIRWCPIPSTGVYCVYVQYATWPCGSDQGQTRIPANDLSTVQDFNGVAGKAIVRVRLTFHPLGPISGGCPGLNPAYANKVALSTKVLCRSKANVYSPRTYNLTSEDKTWPAATVGMVPAIVVWRCFLGHRC